MHAEWKAASWEGVGKVVGLGEVDLGGPVQPGQLLVDLGKAVSSGIYLWNSRCGGSALKSQFGLQTSWLKGSVHQYFAFLPSRSEPQLKHGC